MCKENCSIKRRNQQAQAFLERVEGEAEKVGLHIKEKKINFYQIKYRDVLEVELDKCVNIV